MGCASSHACDFTRMLVTIEVDRAAVWRVQPFNAWRGDVRCTDVAWCEIGPAEMR